MALEDKGFVQAANKYTHGALSGGLVLTALVHVVPGA